MQFLRENDTLNEFIQKTRSEKAKLEEDRDLVKNEANEAQETLELAQSLMSSDMKDIKKLDDIRHMGFEIDDLINIGKFIQKNGFTIPEFIKILETFEDVNSNIYSLIATKESIEEQKDSLSVQIDSLRQEKISLEEKNNVLDNDVILKVAKIKEDFTTFKVTGPLREVYSNSGDVMTVITSTVIYLKNLKRWFNVHITNPHSIVSKIDETIKLLEKVMTRVAA